MEEKAPTLTSFILDLFSKAASTDNAAEALHFSQAALNIANAIAVVDLREVPDAEYKPDDRKPMPGAYIPQESDRL